MLRIAGFVAVLLCIATPRDALCAAPTLSYVYPPGGQRGTKVTVTCTGSFTWPVSVSAPGVDAVPAADSGKLDVTIPADLAADRVWIRLYNAEGASAAVPFLIGSVKEQVEKEPNNSPKTAEVLTETPVTISGVLQKSGDVDGYSLNLTAGQTVVAALDANTRLGSPIDSILQVAMPNGVVVAENHDDVGLDPRVTYTASKAGTYVVRVFAFPATPDSSISFRGGADCLYRLTITTGPYLTHSVPLASSLVDPGTVEAGGWNVPAGTRLPVLPLGSPKLTDPPEWEPLDQMRPPADSKLGLIFAPGMAGSARVRLVSQPVAPALITSDPANPPALAIPQVVTGRLAVAKQADQFRLALKKGEPVVITVESRGLDFPIDPLVSLDDPTGRDVATADDTGDSRDSVIVHSPAKDGEYRLTVTDRHRHGSDRGFYRLTVRPDVPDFELLAASDAIVVTPGKPTELAITVTRRGNVGPIKVEALNLPPGVEAAAVTSEAKGDSAKKVTLTLNSTGPAFSGPLKIQGTATEPAEIKRTVRTPEKLGAAFDSVWLTAIEKK